MLFFIVLGCESWHTWELYSQPDALPCRFYDATGGRVTINGQDISKVTQVMLVERLICRVLLRMHLLAMQNWKLLT